MSDDFKREDSHKKKQTPDSWKKPVGTHSDSRLKKKHAEPMPNPGYRTNKEDRGKHPSGYREVLVHRPEELEELDNEKEAARISSKVGGRKTEMIVEKADELDIKVLNAGEEQDE